MLVRLYFGQKSDGITPGTAVQGQSHRTIRRFLYKYMHFGVRVTADINGAGYSYCI